MMPIYINYGTALCGEGKACDAVFLDASLLPKLMASLADCLPEYLGMLFGQAGSC
jgi:hypothetical protein